MACHCLSSTSLPCGMQQQLVITIIAHLCVEVCNSKIMLVQLIITCLFYSSSLLWNATTITIKLVQFAIGIAACHFFSSSTILRNATKQAKHSTKAQHHCPPIFLFLHLIFLQQNKKQVGTKLIVTVLLLATLPPPHHITKCSKTNNKLVQLIIIAHLFSSSFLGSGMQQYDKKVGTACHYDHCLSLFQKSIIAHSFFFSSTAFNATTNDQLVKCLPLLLLPAWFVLLHHIEKWNKSKQGVYKKLAIAASPFPFPQPHLMQQKQTTIQDEAHHCCCHPPLLLILTTLRKATK